MSWFTDNWFIHPDNIQRAQFEPMTPSQEAEMDRIYHEGLRELNGVPRQRLGGVGSVSEGGFRVFDHRPHFTRKQINEALYKTERETMYDELKDLLNSMKPNFDADMQTEYNGARPISSFRLYSQPWALIVQQKYGGVIKYNNNGLWYNSIKDRVYFMRMCNDIRLEHGSGNSSPPVQEFDAKAYGKAYIMAKRCGLDDVAEGLKEKIESMPTTLISSIL